MKKCPNVRFITVLFVFFWSYGLLHFWSFGNYFGLMVSYLFGPLDSVYGTSSFVIAQSSEFFKLFIINCTIEIPN